jgi:hypothetical protein
LQGTNIVAHLAHSYIMKKMKCYDEFMNMTPGAVFTTLNFLRNLQMDPIS